ncbi:hypothetical protein Bhyg_08280 [Pseudolycoriella hygida]|uniref:Uncharacterized protein n=1 Tax=Pseudolycoriella hygida TaxID=35572 RepID=A0A9Q0S4S4_9DIPT|nr:hypothetical protein Bhyg_08280 [Pseudolycoriella hygida]
MENLEIKDSPRLKRPFPRRSSMFRNPPMKRENVPDDSTLQYIHQLKNERAQWLKLKQSMSETNKNDEPVFTCEVNLMSTELKDFCNKCPDIEKFNANSKAFVSKLEFYKRMENYYASNVKYAEDQLKEKVNGAVTKIFADEIEEKIYLQ